MASCPTSKLRFLDGDGRELPGPIEWQPCFIEINAGDVPFERLELRANGIPLPLARRRIGSSYRNVGEWPFSGTGGYDIELHDGDQTLAAHRCVIRPEKLSDDAYERLVSDLQDQLPASVAIALQQAGALSGMRISPPGESTLAHELHRLRRACRGTPDRAGLIEVLRGLGRTPHQMLRTVDLWMPRDRARRVSPSSLCQTFANPRNLDEQHLPRVLPDQRVEHSVDTYENRLVRTYADEVDVRLRRLVNAWSATGSVGVEAQALLDSLMRARREAEFLDEVSQLAEPPTRLTMVLLKRSEYNAAVQGFLEFRRTATVSLDEPMLQAPLANLPALYELWGTLQVIRLTLEVGASLGWGVTRQRLVRRTEGQIWVRVLPDAAAAVQLDHPGTGSRATLYAQRTYSANPRTTGLHSVSFSKRPDISLEITLPPGQTTVWIFDPKYKLISANISSAANPDEDEPTTQAGLPKRVDLDAMHAYRDAIRRGDGSLAVRYAATLYPGETRIYDEGLAAIRTDPTELEAFEHEVRQVLRSALSCEHDDRTVRSARLSVAYLRPVRC
jgi:hypothetical protein